MALLYLTNKLIDNSEIKFTKPHFKKVNTKIQLEGFANTIYNGEYTITRIVDDYTIVVFNENIPQTNLVTGLGYISIQYTGGLNMVTNLTSEGNNTVSYTFNEQYFSPTNINDIDTSKKPYIHYLLNYSWLIILRLKEYLD